MDRYSNFESLQQREQSQADYRIRRRLGSSGIAILSIHSGEIEPGTSRIADAIAGSEHAFYAFEGVKEDGNLALHITSTRFDEPEAMEIVCQYEIIISIHGCATMEQVVYLGGLDVELKQRILEKLQDGGFQAIACAGPPFGATDQRNICNLCGCGMGVQMEIGRGLRAQMFQDLTPEGRRHRTPVFARFTAAVRSALELFAQIHTEAAPMENTD